MTQTGAHLYLADQRGCSQTGMFRSYHTFNFGQYFDENRPPFGLLRVLNDETLRGGYGIKMQVDEPAQIVIIPLVGGIEYKDYQGYQSFIEAGSILMVSAHQGLEYDIYNPYEEDDLVNFLQIWLTGNDLNMPYQQQLITFDLNQKNVLLPLFPKPNDTIEGKIEAQQENYGFIGKFEGRKEGVYTLKNKNSGILVFVIEGVFEVANRLVNARDTLTLQGVDNIEFEALSNDAIILLLEVNGHQK